MRGAAAGLQIRSSRSVDACDKYGWLARRSHRGRFPAHRFRPADRHAPAARFRLQPGGIRSSSCSCRTVLQHAAADLVKLDGFEQRAEIALAKTLISFALDD